MRWLLLVVMAGSLEAQSIRDARIARGDDRRWTDPAFDDSAWPTVRDRGGSVAEASRTNRLWLRMRVTVPAGEPAAVLVYHCPCEIWLNGVRLGATGDLNARQPVTTRSVRTFPIPASIAAGPAVLAVRQYHPPGLEAAQPFWGLQTIRVVPVSLLGHAGETAENAVQRIYLVRIGVLLIAIGGILAVSAGSRWNATNLAMVAYLGFHAAMGACTAWVLQDQLELERALVWLFGAVVIPLLVFVLARLGRLEVRKTWAALYLGQHLLFRVPWTVGLFLAEPAWWTPMAVRVFLVPSLVGLAASLAIVVLTWQRAREVRLLLAAGILTQLLNLSARLTALGWIGSIGLDTGWVYLNADTLANLLFIGLTTAHIVRSARERRAEEQRLRGELESARTVQELLLSQTLPAGVDAVYVPASEVGGDFYQAYRTPAGTLVVVGDVAGKGLQAAMRVSAIVGALRNRRSNEPGAVLRELNGVLAGSPGFTTCCCALFTEDGRVRMANAGHPSPYVDGREVELEAALPLGLAEDAEFGESVVDGYERVTFVSDGVIEAARADGELFGFGRTMAMSGKPAKEIAEAARAWGQNDDITVVTVRRTGA